MATISEWKDLLKSIEMGIYADDQREEGTLIEGVFYPHHCGEEGTDDDPAGFFHFNKGDNALVIFMDEIEDFDSQEGTWKEIFDILTEYYKKYLLVPDIP